MEWINFLAAIVFIYSIYKIIMLRKPYKNSKGEDVQMPWSEMKPTLYLCGGSFLALFITNFLNGFVMK